MLQLAYNVIQSKEKYEYGRMINMKEEHIFLMDCSRILNSALSPGYVQPANYQYDAITTAKNTLKKSIKI